MLKWCFGWCRWCYRPEGVKGCVSCSSAMTACRMCSASLQCNRWAMLVDLFLPQAYMHMPSVSKQAFPFLMR